MDVIQSVTNVTGVTQTTFVQPKLVLIYIHRANKFKIHCSIIDTSMAAGTMLD